MPTTPTLIWSASNRLDPLYDPKQEVELPVNLVGATPALVYPRGAVLGEVAATPGLFGFYNGAATDGTQTPKMLLRYQTTSLGAGANGGALSAYGGEWGLARSVVPAYFAGTFDLSQISGLDGTALEAMNGRLIEGALGVNESDSIVINATGGTWGLTIPATSGYPAAVVANTGLAYTATATATAAAVNAALAAAGIPATVVVTGGPGASAALILTFHGALAGVPFVLTTDATQLTGGTGTAAVTRPTHGAAPFGVVRFG